jgi:Xaa-Pro aminopeptidase
LTRDTPTLAPAYGQRLALVRDRLAAAGLDGLLVTHPSNLRYLTGFDGSMGALLVTGSGGTLIVDGRYVTSARARLSQGTDLRDLNVAVTTRSYEETIAEVVTTGAALHNLGVEAGHLTLSRFDRLSEMLGRAESAGPDVTAPRLRGTERLVEAVRAIKDAAEVATLREAARRLSAVARGVTSFVRAGRSERDVADDIDRAMRTAGFERPAFATIVASGPNSALPHARPTARVLEAGDGVVLDFGGVYDGYCVDLTRTVQLAPATDAYGVLFDAVRAAHAAAIAAVRPGVAASAIDAAARNVLAGRGLADAFLHGTGHGLGLEVHEEPRISKAGGAGPDEILAAGMVFTIEPGAYVPGLGGVRIEDDVLVVEQGCEVLTDVPIDRTGRGNPAGHR